MHPVPEDAAVRAWTPPAKGAFRNLMRWYRPYLTGTGQRLTWTIVATAVVLFCQAVVPLQVESILHHEVWSTSAVLILLALVVLQLVLGHFAHEGAHDVANRSSASLRSRIFQRTLHSPVIAQEGLSRSSVVGRHTSDVDIVSDAFETTVSSGVPGVIRIILSLALLTFIEWHAGVAMTIATLAFIGVRRFVGRRLLVDDKVRLDANSRLGDSVDETITTSRLVAGLHLTDWVTARYEARVQRLVHATHEQGRSVAQLITGAHAAGLAGLVFVTLFAVIMGGENLAGVAAALLYVEGVVRGLEALPDWVRSLQLAVVSRHRIDMILDAPQEAPSLPKLSDTSSMEIPTLADLRLPMGGLVGLVTPNGIEADAVLTRLSMDGAASGHRISYDGTVVRLPGVGPGTFHVPDDTVAFNASVREHLQSGAPDISDDKITTVLSSVGLAHLAALPTGLDKPLGPTAFGLTANERQRLAVAMALASQPRVLLIGPLVALADADTALPVISTLREWVNEATIVAVRSPEVAEAMDIMIFFDHSGVHVGTHTDLLVSSREYERIWEQRLLSDEVDLSVLGLGDDAAESLYARLVTERYNPGEVIYRQGAAADRIVFTVSGHVEISTEDADGNSRRVAVLGPGNHCGDLRLTVGERRAESAHALDVCVVRSLSRDAIAAGLTGLLDRSPTERRIVSSILRLGPGTPEEVLGRLPDVDPTLFASSLALLVQDGAIREAGGQLSVVSERRTAKPGARDILDRLGDL